MVKGAECREINLRIRRREKNVLDIPLYRTGHSTSLRFYVAFFGLDERYGDFFTNRPGGALPRVRRSTLLADMSEPSRVPSAGILGPIAKRE